ncbi:nucleobase-ascorbate transporter 4-like [Salvia splendens]|uniref:nucleobase-ascorbate transporter 4-like n=1 Tax=Salvia splendens TaxID=180675 RepID=UPI001C25AA97|nr:nucleobase-ascorbate transporter 4-like [Salvia splendens]
MGEAVILGFQHYLVMLGTTVIIPTIIVPFMGGGNVKKAQLMQTLLFVSGINTLLQTWFGTRMPVVIGGSLRFLIPSLYVAFAQRYLIFINPRVRFLRTMRGMQGALMVASVLPMLLGFLGIWRIVVRFLSPLAAVPLIALVGFGLFEQGFPLLAECVEIGLVLLCHSTGAFIAASRYASATHIPSSVISRGIGWLGFGIFLDCLFGTGIGSTVSVFCWSGLTAILQPQQLQNKVHFRLFFLHGAFGLGAVLFTLIPCGSTKWFLSSSRPRPWWQVA